MNKGEFSAGVRSALPIAGAYFAVSFGFGIVAHRAGLSAAACGIMSATNMTSAGQFASIGVISSAGGLLLMAAVQLVINIRYALMSAAISQKIEPSTPTLARALLAFCMTDELFALSAVRPGRLDPWYTWGMMAVVMPAWTAGAASGAAVGSVLSPSLLTALGASIYGMFMAIIVPQAHVERTTAYVILGAMVCMAASGVLPAIGDIPESARLIGVTLIVAAIAAAVDPTPGGEHA